MLIHLESKNCAFKMTKNKIDNITREYFQSLKYINNNLKDRRWIYFYLSCDKDFAKFLILYQHTEDVLRCFYLVEGYSCLAKLE